MQKNEEVSERTKSENKFWEYLKKHGFNIVMILFIGLMFVSPDAKSFVLRQLMLTGLFNASIESKSADSGIQTDNDFNFSGESGSRQSTASLRGKVVFINFWASWCPPCRAEFPSIEALHSKFKNHPDVFFLTINEDTDISKAKAYLAKEKSSIPLFMTNGYVPEGIYSGVLPTTVVLDKNGKIRLHQTGFANYASEKFIKQMEALINE